MNDEQAMEIINEVAEIGKQAIRKEKWLKKNWRFVAICLTIVICVLIVCATAYGITCHLSTISELRRQNDSFMDYVESLVIITETESDYNYDVQAETDKDGNAKANAKGGDS